MLRGIVPVGMRLPEQAAEPVLLGASPEKRIRSIRSEEFFPRPRVLKDLLCQHHGILRDPAENGSPGIHGKLVECKAHHFWEKWQNLLEMAANLDKSHQFRMDLDQPQDFRQDGVFLTCLFGRGKQAVDRPVRVRGQHSARVFISLAQSHDCKIPLRWSGMMERLRHRPFHTQDLSCGAVS